MRQSKREIEATKQFLASRVARAKIHAAMRGRPLRGDQHRATSLAYLDAFAEGMMTEDEKYRIRVKQLRQEAKVTTALRLSIPKRRKG